MNESPTRLSLRHLRADGWTVQIVEQWNPHAGIRQDLFGCIDLLALRGAEVLAVQTTSRGEISRRCRKIATAEHLPAMRAAGWTIHVHGWDQPGGPGTRYRLEVRDVS